MTASPRTRWKGWTIVDKDGNLVLSGFYEPEPHTWKHKMDAEDCKEEGQRVVRCELRVIK